MSLYRGAGGASDATDDSTVNAVAGYASSAASSASAAAASATTATNNATAAATSASQAASSVSTAASSASNAATSASNAASSASSASSSASSASSSASSASTAAGQASNYASEALGYRNTASTHATNAASSASAAAGSATSAADSAADALAIYGNTAAMEAAVADAVEAAATAQQESQDASDSAIAAAESEALAHEHEQNAAEWASFAQVAAGTAMSAATSANAAWDQFDDRYLGAKASDPTADNDGNLLVAGALYFNTSTDSMKVYTGSVWTDAYTTGNGVLLANNNLSDLQSVSTARDNLGLGSIATQAASNVSITGGAISGITDLAIADGGTGASTASDARTNLGLGSAAVLNAGSALGVATLDGGGTVPTSQLPAAVLGSVKYQGTWDASTNTPTLVSSTGTQGYYYVVSTAGSTNLDGISEWKVGDWAIYSGTAWQKIDNTDQVTSVNGYTGTVSLTYSDVGAPSTTGTNATGTWGIDITGNAATVTNGVYTAGDQTIAGAKTFSSNPVLSAGTANGVAYLNGSKVLTTGSALTFDGTNLGVTAAVAAGSVVLKVRNTSATGNANSLLELANDGSSSAYAVLGGSNYSAFGGANSLNFINGYNAPITFSINSSEQMRLTSTGLGIGTSSPVYKLTANVTGGSATALFKTDQATADIYLQASGTSQTYSVGIGASGNALRFLSGASSNMLLDSSGNLGLGVTPSAWGSGIKAMDLGAGSAVVNPGSTAQTWFLTNAYHNAGFKYKNTGDLATWYQQTGGTHAWYTAPSGTAGNAISFTQAMTLDASGNLGIGTTSPSVRLHAIGSVGGYAAYIGGATYQLRIYTDTAQVQLNTGGGEAISFLPGSNALAFATNSTERARIDSSGNLLVGKTTTSVSVSGNVLAASGAIGSSIATGNDTFYVYNTTATAYRFYVTDGGTVYATSTSISAISDATLKENVRDLETGLSEVMALKPRRFDWKNGDAQNVAGFVAQEVEQVLPELVTDYIYNKDEDGNDVIKKSLKMGDILPTLVKAVQEQQAIINAQQTALEQLKARLDAANL